MINRKIGLALGLCLILASSVLARAGDLAGTWVGSVDAGGAAHSVTFVFKVDDGVITGTVTPDGDSTQPISEGKIDGNKITFKAGPGTDLITFSGTLDGDELKLTISFPGGGNEGFSLVAKRKTTDQ
jgi:hypothetical protein